MALNYLPALKYTTQPFREATWPDAQGLFDGLDGTETMGYRAYAAYPAVNPRCGKIGFANH